MKKRILALLCVLALCLTLLPFALGADPYEGIYLVGVNDTVLLNLINDTYMPVRRIGVIYGPYTILDNSELGLSYALNKTDGTFTIFNRKKTLIFYTTGDGARDKEGNTYSDRVFSRNGNIYIPLRFVANFFDLTYSYYNIPLKEGAVPIIRLRNEYSHLSDGQFGSAAVGLVQQPITQYAATHATPSPSPTPTSPLIDPTPTPTPTRAPTVIAPVSPSPTPSSTPKSLNFSLAISATDGSGFSDILRTLEQNGKTALFLFAPEDLAQRDDDVRAAAASGHQIGLILGEEDPEGDYAEGNRLLKHILRSGTAQVTFSAAETDGSWWVWRNNVTLRGGSAQKQAENLLADLESRSYGRVTFTDSAFAARTLRQFFSQLSGRTYTYRIPTETT